MRMSVILGLVGFTLLWLIGAVLFFSPGKASREGRERDADVVGVDLVKTEVVFPNARFSVDIADTEAKRELGLGKRETLCEHCGMLFVFDHPDRYAFWMKDMRFPIDILWIAHGRVVSLEESVDFHDQKRIYVPNEGADKVIELPAGSAERFGIHVGDNVVIGDEL